MENYNFLNLLNVKKTNNIQMNNTISIEHYDNV